MGERKRGKRVYITADELECLKLALDAMEIDYSEHLIGGYRSEEIKKDEERMKAAKEKITSKLDFYNVKELRDNRQG